jgi:Tfp pilus assembly PilM family ATPase
VSVLSSLFVPPPPTVAIELASRRITVVEVGRGAKGASVVGYASEALPADAIQPAAGGVNIPNVGVVADALRRALERAGVRSTRRAALIVPDSVARVSLITFEQLPPKTADVEQLVRWQLKKATPYPIEEAQVTWFPAHKSAGGTVLAAMAARRDVIAEYEAVASAVGVHAGLVDLACLNVMNTVMAANAASAADWLLISMAPEATALAIGRGTDLMFYRHRPTVEDEPLSALVHQTAMYHEDRLGGTRFSRVWLCGGGVGKEAEQARLDIQKRLGVPVEPVDIRSVADLGGRINASTDVLDALAAPVGVLLRDRKAA